MKQNRIKLFTSLTLLMAIIVAASSCKKLGYDENADFTHCYCEYYTAPGFLQYEDVRMHTSAEHYANLKCVQIQQDMAAKHGSSAKCSIY